MTGRPCKAFSVLVRQERELTVEVQQEDAETMDKEDENADAVGPTRRWQLSCLQCHACFFRVDWDR